MTLALPNPDVVVPNEHDPFGRPTTDPQGVQANFERIALEWRSVSFPSLTDTGAGTGTTPSTPDDGFVSSDPASVTIAVAGTYEVSMSAVFYITAAAPGTGNVKLYLKTNSSYSAARSGAYVAGQTTFASLFFAPVVGSFAAGDTLTVGFGASYSSKAFATAAEVVCARLVQG